MSAYDFLRERSVTRLCHFTKLQSVTHIISEEEGILARSSIRQDIKNVVDQARYDGELDYVCCSVQYPNSWFLRSAIKNDTDQIFRDWVVLYIDLKILIYKIAKFCPCNASKEYGKYVREDMENIGEIFLPSVPTFSYARPSAMLSACPTDGQAEILIKDNIPFRYIIGIATGTKDIASRVYAMLKTCDVEQVPIYIAPNVLSTRWSRMIRSGCEPEEMIYTEIEEE